MATRPGPAAGVPPSAWGGLAVRLATGLQGGSNGGLGEGDAQVLVVVQLLVVKGDQRLHRLLHRPQLQQRHLSVLPEDYRK